VDAPNDLQDMHRMRTFLARMLAFVSAGLSTWLWLRLAFFPPAGPGGLADMGSGGPPAWVVAALFTGVAWSGAVATFRHAPLVTVIVGFISLVPVGLVFVGAPGAFRLLSVAPLMMLGAGLLLFGVPAGNPDPPA